jgi:putative transposon-encoded protein
MSKDKPEIIRELYEGDEVIEFSIKKEVTPIGRSGHVILPQRLIGKIVEIKYKKSDGK